MNKRSNETLIDETNSLLITAAAAMAANGDFVLRETLSTLMEKNVSKETITLPLFVGQQVRERPAANMLEVADMLIDTDYAPKEEHSCPATKLDRSTTSYKIMMLIAAGSAMAANCEPCLNHIVPNLIEAGVANADIRKAVEIGLRVKEKIKAASAEFATQWIQSHFEETLVA